MNFPVEIEVPVHLLGTVAVLIVVLILRALLDLEMGAWIVRCLHWVPTRWIFRNKYTQLNGEWEHYYDGDSTFPERDRHGHHHMYQLFRWIYADTRSKGKVFTAFGRIQGEYLIGRWYDKHDEKGYFGTFELRIIDGDNLQGKWMGHSKKNPNEINIGAWKWTRHKD